MRTGNALLVLLQAFLNKRLSREATRPSESWSRGFSALDSLKLVTELTQ